MPLIGTISGSNGTSTTAISGSVIIADAPVSTFPSLPAGVKVYFSGSKNATRTDNPEVLFNIDVFHSGAIGSDQYIQFKPVNILQIPSNTTASYIYTSGSTNDMYFTQYNGPYTNTTRLRWLEAGILTGLLNGGVLSTVNGTTTFNVSSGSGLIITYNASLNSDPFPTIVKVDWPNFVSSSLPNITTKQITYIAIDSSGSLVKQNTAYTDGDFESKIIIGRVLHQSGSVTNGTITQPTVSYGQTGFRGDFIRAFGPLKLSGHVVSVNATATNPPTNTQFLGLAKTSGDSYVEGRNYTTNPNSPNYIKSTTDTALTTSKIFREYVNSSGTVVIDSGVANAGYTAVDVTNYNNNGVLTAIGGGNKFTIQRLYWFPNAVNRAIFAYYGNAIYTSIAAAEIGIESEIFTEGDNTRDGAILLGYLIVKQGTTDLNDAAKAKLIQAGLSRAISSTGGGGGATSPGGSDTYVQFNDAASFGGESGFTYNKTTESVTIAGNLTASNVLLSGDIAVNGGDITSTSATFNLLTGSVTSLNIGGTATALSIGAATGRTTINNDLAITTGNIIGAPGSGANMMTLISSGNIIAKLDIDNNAAGHKFIIQDYREIEQFSVQENGNAEISGSLVVTGSLATNGGEITTTVSVFNLLTGSITTLSIGGLATNNVFGGNISVAGLTTLSTISEKLVNSNGSTGTVNFDLGVQGIFYVNGPAGDITANFTTVSTTNNRIITPTVIFSQSATARIVSAVQIDSSPQTINWANGVTPVGSANKQDVFGFSLIRSGSAWKVLGQMSTYG